MSGASFPTQALVASWSSLKARSRCFCVASRTWLPDFVTAPSMQEVEPSRLPSIAFAPGGPLVYQWQVDRRSTIIKPMTPSKYEDRRRLTGSIENLKVAIRTLLKKRAVQAVPDRRIC